MLYKKKFAFILDATVFIDLFEHSLKEMKWDRGLTQALDILKPLENRLFSTNVVKEEIRNDDLSESLEEYITFQETEGKDGDESIRNLSEQLVRNGWDKILVVSDDVGLLVRDGGQHLPKGNFALQLSAQNLLSILEIILRNEGASIKNINIIQRGLSEVHTNYRKNNDEEHNKRWMNLINTGGYRTSEIAQSIIQDINDPIRFPKNRPCWNDDIEIPASIEEIQELLTFDNFPEEGLKSGSDTLEINPLEEGQLDHKKNNHTISTIEFKKSEDPNYYAFTIKNTNIEHKSLNLRLFLKKINQNTKINFELLPAGNDLRVSDWKRLHYSYIAIIKEFLQNLINDMFEVEIELPTPPSR